jgi:glutathione S-transferase
MPTLQLTYFNAPGRAEPIRMALHMAGLAFEDRRLDYPAFAAAKAAGEFPLGAVPVLTIDGLAIAQTSAILRYVARLGAPALYPADPAAALLVDSALDSFNDTLSHALTPSMFERDMEKKLAMRAALLEGPMRQVLLYVEQLIAHSEGPFVAGAAMSIADLTIATQVLAIRGGHLDGISAAALAPYERIEALTDACLADPRVIAYLARG